MRLKRRSGARGRCRGVLRGLFARFWDGLLRRWSLEQGRSRKPTDGRSENINSLAFYACSKGSHIVMYEKEPLSHP